MKHLPEIFVSIDSAAMITEKCNFNFERASRLRAGLQDVLSVYKNCMTEK